MNTLFQGVQWIAPTDLGVSQFCLKVGQTTWFAQLFHVSLFCRKAAMTDGDYQKQLLPDRMGQKTWWPHTMCGATRLHYAFSINLQKGLRGSFCFCLLFQGQNLGKYFTGKQIFQHPDHRFRFCLHAVFGPVRDDPRQAKGIKMGDRPDMKRT